MRHTLSPFKITGLYTPRERSLIVRRAKYVSYRRRRISALRGGLAALASLARFALSLQP